MKLESIPVQVTGPASGMTNAILVEIAELLQQLAEKDVSGAINLRSLPLSEEDRTRLEDRLGHGEVSAQLDVAGTTEVWETSYPGVWWIRHHGGDGRIAAEEIAVTHVPEFLMSPKEDIRAAAARINAEMHPTETSASEEEALHV